MTGTSEAAGDGSPAALPASSSGRPTFSRRLHQVVVGGATAAFGLWIAMWVVMLANPTSFGRFYGQDLRLYVHAADRWLDGGGFYNAYQLAGPYALSFGDILYPPPSLLLFVPFTIIPLPLWWAIPAVAVSVSAARLRPAPWALLAIMACLWWPDSIFRIVLGNPVLSVVTFLAIGTIHPIFSPFAFIKPTLAPAALLNVRRRGWWTGLGVAATASLAFAPMWPAYWTAIANLRVEWAWAYSLRELPLVAVPWLAWLGRTRP